MSGLSLPQVTRKTRTACRETAISTARGRRVGARPPCSTPPRAQHPAQRSAGHVMPPQEGAYKARLRSPRAPRARAPRTCTTWRAVSGPSGAARGTCGPVRRWAAHRRPRAVHAPCQGLHRATERLRRAAQLHLDAGQPEQHAALARAHLRPWLSHSAPRLPACAHLRALERGFEALCSFPPVTLRQCVSQPATRQGNVRATHEGVVGVPSVLQQRGAGRVGPRSVSPARWARLRSAPGPDERLHFLEERHGLGEAELLKAEEGKRLDDLHVERARRAQLLRTAEA